MQPRDDNSTGDVNLRIRRWDETWQTPDIYFDSKENGWDNYTAPLDDDGLPLGQGDAPIVDGDNRFKANVWNDMAEHTATVAFSVHR